MGHNVKKKESSVVKNVSYSLGLLNEKDNSHKTSPSDSVIFHDQVQSVYERLKEKELLDQRGKEMQDSLTQFSLSVSRSHDRKETTGSTMAHRVRHPMVPLDILERIQLVFELYEWSQKKKRRPLSCFEDAKQREEEEMNELAALIRSKEMERKMRAHNEYKGLKSIQGGHVISTSDTASPGIPFSAFERFIAEPFFDFLFPPQNTTWQSESLLETLKDRKDSLATTMTMSFGVRSLRRTHTRIFYQRRRTSQVEALEHLFCVMDTNGDGFVSWDEFSSYILRSGEQLLMSNEYSSVDKTEKQNGMGKGKGQKRIKVDVPNFATRVLNFSPTPVNVSIWQQQYPLVRYLFHSEPITRLILTNRGRRYVTTGLDGLVKLWRSDPRLVDDHGKPSIVHERNLFAAGAPIMDMVLSSDSFGDSEVLGVIAMDGSVTLLRVGTGEVLKTFIGRWEVRSLDVEGNRRTSLTPTDKQQQQGGGGGAEKNMNLSLSKGEVYQNFLGGTVVLRPFFKIRAYHREAIEIFFTEVSRYFAGLGVVAPTYEHLELRRPVKLDVLLQFGGIPDPSIQKKQKFSLSTSCFDANDDVTSTHDDMHVNKDKNENENVCSKKSDIEEELQAHQQQHEQQRRESKYSALSFDRRPRVRNSERCWFARSVGFLRHERVNSTSVLKSGVFLLLGFETGVLQIYPMRAEWFTVANLSSTRVEPSTTYEPVLSLTLHRAAITSILTSEPHDLLMTASDDGTVVVRHIGRVQVPFMTLGDGVPPHGLMIPFFSSGHVKRITCICTNDVRGIIVTGGADRFVIFWTFFSSRALYRIDLSTFFQNSGSAGIPLDVSFLQPPHQPLMLLVLDSKRTLYFIDIVSYQCLKILHDDSLASLRAGDMLRARYDAVDERLILGGRHVRVWDLRQFDEYPQDYCGHRRAVVGLAYQRAWSFWVSADDSIIIIWNAMVLNLQTDHIDTIEKDVDKSKENATRLHNCVQPLGTDCCHWALGSSIARSWSVEGGICALAVEETESSHVFVALIQKRCILEYNIFSGSVLRSFSFPENMGEISSLACGASTKGPSLMRRVPFLCGTFEREHSSNGTTALYALPSGGDVMSSMELTGSLHRCITTTGVGVSCAIIVPILGLVVVGHRGGISVTPVDEATTCPIMCTRLTDLTPRKRTDTNLTRRSSHFSVSTTSRAPVPLFRSSIITATTTTTNTPSNFFQAGSRPVDGSSVHDQSCLQPSAVSSLDLVALFPGPLLQDPVALTREFMQQRERYLFNEEKSSKAPDGKFKSHNSRPLLLFSDEFLASASVFSSGYGVFLQEQLSTLGYVGLITPVAQTEFVVSGSDDGLLQFWDLCSMSELMRFRATYALDAVTSIKVSDDTLYLVVGDANGYILLIDISCVPWQPGVPFEKRITMEESVCVLQRWRGHRQCVTAVHFVEQNQDTMRRESLQSLTIHRSLRVATRKAASHGDDDKTSTLHVNEDERNKDMIHDGICRNANNNNNNSKRAIFLCTSGEDSYIYTWRWETGASFGGSVYCLGCFGGGTRVPPEPPLDKLTNCAWRVLEMVRKTYITERLLTPGGMLSRTNMEASIYDAVSVIKKEISIVKGDVGFSQRVEEVGTVMEKKPGVRMLPLILRDRGYTFHVGSQHRSGDICLSTYVLAFEDGLYYDRDLFELLKRLVNELTVVENKQKTWSAKEIPTGGFSGGFSLNKISDKNVSTVKPCLTHAALNVVETEPDKSPDIFTPPEVVSDSIEQPREPSVSLSVPLVSFFTPPATPSARPTGGVESETQRGVIVKESEVAGDSILVEGNRRCSFFFSPACANASVQFNTPHKTSALEVPTPSFGEKVTVTPGGSRIGQAEENNLNFLPSLTVSFATSSPIPRMRRVDSNVNKKEIQLASTTDTLPLLSQVIRRPDGKVMNEQYGNGVKILLREKPKGHSCGPAFIENLNKPHLTSDTDKTNPEQLSLQRLKKKRLNEKWGAARIMGTLMGWNAPRVFSDLYRSNNCGSNNNENEKDITLKCTTDSVTIPSINTTIFIPPNLGISKRPITPKTVLWDGDKSVTLTLRDEMEAMKTRLQAKMQEKQLLIAQENMTKGGTANSM